VIYARDGIDLDRALLASWVGAASALLRPLVEAIRRMCWQVPSCTRTTRRFRCWHREMARPRLRACGPTRDDRASGDTAPAAVWFAYTPDRKGIHPQTHLAKFKGCCKRTPMPGSMHCSKTERFKKLPAGRMHGESSTICTKPGRQP
jgi:hypothetical protein